MASLKFVSVFFTAIMAVMGGNISRPKPAGSGLLSGTHSLGMVMPQLSGWGWNAPTTVPPETTTGWSVEETTGWLAPETTTTTASPETTTSGWSAPETTTTPGWSVPETTVGWSASPETASVNIEMAGQSTAIGVGEVGATHGSQTTVTGDATNPAIAVINTGSYSSLGQGSGVLQISNINSNGESNTFQGIDGYNFGDSGDTFSGSLSGNEINTINGGGAFVVGQGAIGQGGFTFNSNGPIHVPYGWKQE